jgi:hypothetical protein
MGQLHSFAQWLARHAGLVNSLSMKRGGMFNAAVGLPYKAHLAAAQELLQLSIHAAGATQAAEDSTHLSAPCPAAAATAATAAAAEVSTETAAGGSQQQQHQQHQQHHHQKQGLRLRSFSSSLPKAVGMLAALQVQHLTSVGLGLQEAMTDSSALSMALARPSNLQQLRLGGMVDASLGTALTTLVQLPQLTLLEFYNRRPSRGELESQLSVALQQVLAQPLLLQRLQLPVGRWYRLPILNMSLLTKLTELSTGSCWLAEASVLPAQLQRLQFNSWDGAGSMAPLTRLELKQLQHLSLRVDFRQPQLLLQLAQLPALTHLALQYDDYRAGQLAADTASAWALLPQLRELEIAHDGIPPCQPQWEAILTGAAASTSLTKLVLDARMVSEHEGYYFEPESDDEVAVCARLANSTRLQDLTVGGGSDWVLNLVRGDALALTALTGLTRLVLYRAEHGVGTAVATALARSLQQLQSLDIRDCCLQLGSAEGLACLEVIGRLTQLTQLSLGGCEDSTQHGLMQLMGLSRLQRTHGYDLCSALQHVTLT